MYLTDERLALLTAHSYNDRNPHGAMSIRGMGVQVNYLSATLMRENEVEAIGYDFGDYYVLAFRGTEFTANSRRWYVNWLDIVRDLRFFPWRAKYGWVHAGFYFGAKVWLEKHWRQVPKNRPLILTGHSMGASIAVNVALQTHSHVHRVRVFGEPNGLFKSSVRSYQALGLARKTKSFLTDQDWIKVLPPWGRRSVDATPIGRGGHSIWDYVRSLHIVHAGL